MVEKMVMPDKQRLKELKSFDCLTEKQKTFCRNIESGMTNCEAYLCAGYSIKGDHKDRKVRQRASQEANKLMRNPTILWYIHRNDTVTGDLDTKEIVSRMRLIMNGKLFYTMYTKKGDPYPVPPSYKEEVMAGELLLKILKFDEDRALKTDKSVGEISDQLKKRSLNLLSSYQAKQPTNIEATEVENI